MRILIADDHKIFREGLASLLLAESDFCVVGEVSDGRQAIHLLQGGESVDLLILDVEMPVMDGFETMQAMKDMDMKTPVLALTMHKTPQFIKNILKAGAAGYLQKDTGKIKLIEAIKAIHEKGSFYTPEAGQILMESMKESKTASEISPREIEIIKLICDQMTTAEIAERLFISKHTVESHRQNILLKLDLKNTAGLVKYAVQKRLI